MLKPIKKNSNALLNDLLIQKYQQQNVPVFFLVELI